MSIELKTRWDSAQVIEQAEDDHKERMASEMDQQAIINELRTVIPSVNEVLQYVYDLTLLEAKLVSDEFHQTKSDFKNFGLTYGYLMCYASRQNGTNYMRFSRRIPNASSTGANEPGTQDKKSKFHYESIKKAKRGYSTAQFHRLSKHQEEFQLCIDTEEQFMRLRKQGEEVKKVMKALRALQVIKTMEQPDATE